MPRTRDVAVIGGTGFIGGHLVRALLDRGRTVRVLSRQPRRSEHGVSYVHGDMANEKTLRAVMENAESVCHLATGGGERWQDFERDVIQGTRQIALLCQEYRVRRLLYTSSVAALYGGGRRRIDERTGVDDQGAKRSLYSRSKIAAEAVLNEMQVSTGLPVVTFRPGVVVGPGGTFNHTGFGSWPSDTCCVGWGRGDTPLPLVLVSDVVAAMVKALDATGIDGMTFNLVGDVRIPASRYVKLLAARSHRNFRFYPQSLLKMQVMEIGKWLLKMAARKNENPFPSFRDLKSRSLRAPFDCSATKRVLGWRPVSNLDDFLRQAIDASLPAIHPSDLRLVHSHS